MRALSPSYPSHEQVRLVPELLVHALAASCPEGKGGVAVIFSCTIPVPPSVNEMFVARHQAGKTGKSLSYEYRKWRDNAALMLKARWVLDGRPEIPKPFAVNLSLGINHKSDIDNRVKAALDVLCKAIPTPGDQWIDRLVVTRGGEADSAMIVVEAV